MGGSNAADKVNWNQLKGREVIIWGDNDEVGFKAAEVIKDKLNKANDHMGFVSVVDPTHLKFNNSVHKDLLPEKWDLADRLPEGMTTLNVKEVIENVRAAHLDFNQIQSVLQSTNASDTSQQVAKRNIWQEVFKGKIVNEEKITSLAANEFKAATFFSSEASGNYIKYLEATGKGGVAHDYLKYDSPMYQDLLTSLAVSDERLSDGIKGLSSNNTADISNDTETIEAKTKLIDNAQNLYEKKALEYSGIAGTHEVYRDYLELMIKNYGEAHGKVALYKEIIRDVSILHSAQLGMNINDLPDSHHKDIAGTIYNNVTNYKAANGRGQSEHNIDNHDKAKIATNCYAQLCGSNAWSERALNGVKVADNALSSVNLSRQEDAATLLKQEKHKIKDILKLNPKFDQEALKQTLGKVGASEQEDILNKVWLGEFKAKVLPELDVLQKEKVASKTVNELIGVFKKEKEYCLKVEKTFPELTQTLDHQGQNSHIAMAATYHTVRPKMIEEMHADILTLQKYSGWNDKTIISTINMHQDISRQADAIFSRTQSHIIDSIEDNLHKLSLKGVIEHQGEKFENAVDYLHVRISDQGENKYLADSSIETKYHKMINSSMSDNTDSSNMATAEEQKLTLIDGAQTQLNGPRIKL
jgi:hypothetical protein